MCSKHDTTSASVVAGILRKSNGMTVQLKRKLSLQLEINNPKYMRCKLTF